MNIALWGRFAVLAIFLAACSQEKQSTQKIFDFDGLIDQQVNYLADRKIKLDKKAEMEGRSSDSIFVPSVQKWKTELDIFRQLEVLNKPSYRSSYKLEDSLKDTNSNLKVRQYSIVSEDGRFKSPVTLVRFYYHNDFERIKKIEAVVRNENMLYLNDQLLVMEFEEQGDKPALTHYSMKGIQKMILSDTVHFSIQGQIDW